ncbi:MAG: hypothetical protein H6Q04_1506 [Acidobacteria bacterium]|nr:hypothetical protein [Acidobacteriota bacterium]
MKAHSTQSDPAGTILLCAQHESINILCTEKQHLKSGFLMGPEPLPTNLAVSRAGCGILYFLVGFLQISPIEYAADS